jgi:hypothetical protein
MNRNEPEILAVRQIPPAMADPADESVSRTWHLMTRRRALADRPTRRYLRWAIPVVATAAVGALAVGVSLALPHKSGNQPGGQPVVTLPSPENGKSPQPNTAVTTGDTVAALNALANKAQAGTQTPIPAGKLMYVKHDGYATATNAGSGESHQEPQLREYWFDPQGAILLKCIADGVDMATQPKSDMEGNIAQARAYLAEHGPGIHNPTPQWLASLPTDPAALRSKLRELIGNEAPAWSTDHELWSAMNDFYLYGDLMLTPQQRATFLRSFTGLKGLTSSEVLVGGKRLIAIRHTERGHGDEVLFDPETGMAVGRASVTSEGSREYQATWTQAIVGSLTETH